MPGIEQIIAQHPGAISKLFENYGIDAPVNAQTVAEACQMADFCADLASTINETEVPEQVTDAAAEPELQLPIEPDLISSADGKVIMDKLDELKKKPVPDPPQTFMGMSKPLFGLVLFALILLVGYVVIRVRKK